MLIAVMSTVRSFHGPARVLTASGKPHTIDDRACGPHHRSNHGGRCCSGRAGGNNGSVGTCAAGASDTAHTLQALASLTMPNVAKSIRNPAATFIMVTSSV